PGSPRPDRRRDVIENGNGRSHAAHATRNPVSEVGTVDDDEGIRSRRDDSVRGLTDAAQDQRQAPRNRREANDRDVIDRERAGDSGRRHGPAADTGKLKPAALTLHERKRQRRAEGVARLLGRDQIKRERPLLRAGAGHARASGTPMRKRPAPSAAATVSAASAMIVLPAATAIPARPACAALRTVAGPIAGKSKRRSWPGLGALTRTPTRSGAVTRPSRRRSERRTSRLSVPSAASTASTWLLATTTARPTSNGPITPIKSSARVISERSRCEG